MRNYKISLGVVISLLASAAAYGQAQTISKVRQAAIDRMQNKLGLIRGSIDSNSQNIFLTSKMIEQLKPISEAPEISEQPTTTQIAANVVAVPESESSRSRRLAKEIYQSVGLKNVDRKMITNSINAPLPELKELEDALPSTAEMDSILKSVDAMIEAEL